MKRLVGGGADLGPVLVAVGEEVRRTAPHALAQPQIDLVTPPPAPSRPTPVALEADLRQLWLYHFPCCLVSALQ